MSPDFLPPVRCDFPTRERENEAFVEGFPLKRHRSPFLAWGKSHLAGGRRSGLTNWCAFGPQGSFASDVASKRHCMTHQMKNLCVLSVIHCVEGVFDVPRDELSIVVVVVGPSPQKSSQSSIIPTPSTPLPSRPKLSQKTSLQKDCLGAINFVIITKTLRIQLEKARKGPQKYYKNNCFRELFCNTFGHDGTHSTLEAPSLERKDLECKNAFPCF